MPNIANKYGFLPTLNEKQNGKKACREHGV
jgi:hypothetical protein